MIKPGAKSQTRSSMPPEVAEALARRGAKTAIVRRCGLSMGRIQSWGNVPVRYVDVVSDIIGLTKEQIRPDMFLKKNVLPKRSCLRCDVRFEPETRLFFMCQKCRSYARDNG